MKTKTSVNFPQVLSQFINDKSFKSTAIKLNKIINKKIIKKKSIFFAVNGGSAAISNHALCDFLKNYKVKSSVSKFFSLSSNNEIITAISNDYSYDQIFSFQLEKLADSGDLLILVSSSGNSANILRAAKTALRKNMDVFSLIGFDGGKLKKMSKDHYHVNSNNYGICEDLHMSLLHYIIDLNNSTHVG